MSTVKHLPKNQQNCRLKRLWLKRVENQKRSPPLFPNRWFAHLRNHPVRPIWSARASNCSGLMCPDFGTNSLLTAMRLSEKKGFLAFFLAPYCWWKKSVDRHFIPLFTGFYTSRVVQDFFHQQYDWHILDICGVCGSMFWQMSGISEYPITFPITHQTLFATTRGVSYYIIIRPNQTLRHYALSLSFISFLLNQKPKKKCHHQQKCHALRSSRSSESENPVRPTPLD